MARPFIKLQANAGLGWAGLGWAGLGRCGLDPAVALPRTAAALVLRCRVKLSAGSAEQENVCLAPICGYGWAEVLVQRTVFLSIL